MGIRNRKRKRSVPKRTVGSKDLEKTKKEHSKAKKSSAYITSQEWAPITPRTYALETKRKGSTKGYKKIGNKHYKARTVVK